MARPDGVADRRSIIPLATALQQQQISTYSMLKKAGRNMDTNVPAIKQARQQIQSLPLTLSSSHLLLLLSHLSSTKHTHTQISIPIIPD